MNEQINSYRHVDTIGKSQVDLILQVYSGAIQALKAGRVHYSDNQFNEGYEKLEHARKFIVHLYTTLDFEQGGEVAQNLGKLYVFVMGQLDVIEATKDLAKIDSCIQVLDNLRQGWDQLRQQEKSTKGFAAPTASAESLVISA